MTSQSTQETSPQKEEPKEEAKVISPSAKGRYVEVSLKEISHGAEVAIILKEIQRANYLRCIALHSQLVFYVAHGESNGKIDSNSLYSYV